MLIIYYMLSWMRLGQGKVKEDKDDRWNIIFRGQRSRQQYCDIYVW